MAKIINPKDFAVALGQELEEYRKEVVDQVDKTSGKAARKLVKITKATAPVGKRESYRRNIALKKIEHNLNSSTYVWYVKEPDHRLTHLLVHGHATKDGGRTKADPFLHNAVDTVLPEYEEQLKEALKK